MRIQNAGFARGSFFAFAAVFRNWIKKKNLFPALVCDPTFNVLDTPHMFGKAGALKSLEKNPVVAAIGHVCEYVLENNDAHFFHHSLLDLVTELSQPQDKLRVAHPPRALDWELVVDSATQEPRLTHGTVEAQIRHMFTGQMFAAAKAEDVPLKTNLSPDSWLTQYAQTVLHLVSPCSVASEGDESFEWVSVSHFFHVQWPLLFDELCMMVVVQIDQSSAPIINEQIRLLNNLNIQVDLVMSYDHSLMQLDHLGHQAHEQVVRLRVHPPPSVTFMFHTAGDIIATARWTPVGTRCMFNGGSLLATKAKVIEVKTELVENLHKLVFDRQLRLGIYVNEEHICTQALLLLIELCNSRQDVFSLGFSYGNVNGILVDRPYSGADISDSGVGVHYLAGRNDAGNWRLS